MISREKPEQELRRGRDVVLPPAVRRGILFVTVALFLYPVSYTVLRATGVFRERIAYLNGFDESGNWETTSRLTIIIGDSNPDFESEENLFVRSLVKAYLPCAALEHAARGL